MKQALGLALVAVVLAAVPASAKELDFGDRSSATLTSKAWKALTEKEYADAVAYAKKCVELYEKAAIEMQKELKAPLPNDDREAVAKKWALNDVGTCFFIMGQALEKQDKGKEALASYKQLIGKSASRSAGTRRGGTGSPRTPPRSVSSPWSLTPRSNASTRPVGTRPQGTFST